MTKREVAALFAMPLELDPAVLQSLQERFRRLGRPMPAVNRTQAEVPHGATVLPNPRGTAPGLWLEANGKVAVMLPGVPSEMRGLLVEEVLPRIAARQKERDSERRVVQSRTVRTTGVAESALAERVGDIEPAIAPLTLAYLPSTDGVDLRVTAWRLGEDEAKRRLDEVALAARGAVRREQEPGLPLLAHRGAEDRKPGQDRQALEEDGGVGAVLNGTRRP